MKTAEDLAEALGLRCAATAEHRGDTLTATAPPASRWLLIEHRAAWPRKALTALAPTPTHQPSEDPRVADLAAEVARLCAAAGIRPVLIRRHGRQDRSIARRWALVDSRPGQESVRWGDLPTDDHLLNVLSGRDPGTPSTDPIYLICTHGRHDACCAIRGRPAAAALSTAFPDRTWECSHVGGDRFAANLVFLPHSLFYGHVPSTEAVELATQYNEGLLVPKYLRGSGAHPPPVQAAQHFARAAGAPLSINALHPTHQTTPTSTTWQIHLSTTPNPTNTAAPTIPTLNPNAAATNAIPSTTTHASTDATDTTQANAGASTNPNPNTSTSNGASPSASVSDTANTNASASTNANAAPSASVSDAAGTNAIANTNASASPSTSGLAGTNASASTTANESDRDNSSANESMNVGGNSRNNSSATDSASDRDSVIDNADASENGRDSASIDDGASVSDNAHAGSYVVTLTVGRTTIDAAMTCASQPPGHVTTYTLTSIEQTYQ
ncbi:sucrase ferredoxin [Kribbella sp. NPDC051718]|uniref:sucrase ferredoxin n=1 Tax=Kribbella sp. NPDC051718 TaxID=3155168 RepID=UPI0034360755